MNFIELLLYWMFFSLFHVKSDGVKLSMQAYNGSDWKPETFKAMSVGTELQLRCLLLYDESYDIDIKLTRKLYADDSTSVLNSTQSSELNFVIPKLHLNDSGIYECISGSFSKNFIINVFALQDLVNVTVPTRQHVVLVERIVFTQRQLDHRKYNERIGDTGDVDFWLSCSLFLGVRDLDVVSVHWLGGLLSVSANKTESAHLYTVKTTQDRGLRRISTKIRLNFLVTDQPAYGEYRCVFSPHRGESIVGTVYLHVPPIIRLLHGPPPPLPDNSSSGHFTCPSPCLLEPVSSSNDTTTTTVTTFSGETAPGNQSTPVAQWHSACSTVVAYPPTEVLWAWSRPEHANATVHFFLSRGLASLLARLHQMTYTRGDDGTDVVEDVYGPRVLERRRRFVDPQRHLAIVQVKEIMGLGPAVFWCWARNQWGDTAVWWPGTREEHAVAWSSAVWPLFGVSLELVGLTILFVGFYYCCRKGRQADSPRAAAVVVLPPAWARWAQKRLLPFGVNLATRDQESIPFHLLPEDTASSGSGVSVAMKSLGGVSGATGQLAAALAATKSQQVAYTRLASDDLEEVVAKDAEIGYRPQDDQRSLGCDNLAVDASLHPGETDSRHCRTDGQAEPNTGEEYFWDSDAEGAPGVGTGDTLGRTGGQRC